jgi:hypothetical protein
MPVSITCPKCGNQIQAREHLSGRTLRCHKCLSPFTVPKVAMPAPPAWSPPPVAVAPKPAAPKPPAPVQSSGQEFELGDDALIVEEPAAAPAPVPAAADAGGEEEFVIGEDAAVEAGEDDEISIGEDAVVQGEVTDYGVALFTPNTFADLEMPENLQKAVQDELRKGEKIVWAGRPDPELAGQMPKAVMFIMGLFFVAVGVGLALVPVFYPQLGDGKFFIHLIMYIVGGVFAVLGLFAAVMPLMGGLMKKMAARHRCCYVLTSRRAIIAFGKVDAEEFDVDGYDALKLGNMERKDNKKVKGAGDLVFGTGSKNQLGVGAVTFSSGGQARDPFDQFGSRRMGPPGGPMLPFGFLRIRQVREIERLIRETLKV